MNCRNCHSPVLDKKLLCPKCVAALSHKAILAAQGDFLPAVVRGDPPLRLARRRSLGRQDPWHIEMLGYSGQAFCGALFEKKDIEGHKLQWERQPVVYNRLSEKELCADCFATLTRRVKESFAEVA